MTDPEQTIRPCPIALLRTDELAHPERAVARGDVQRVRRGIYVPVDAWRDLAPWDRYLARVHAVAGSYPDAVFSHESAAVLLGLGVIGDPGAVHILVESASASRMYAGVRAHARSDPSTPLDVGGLLVTSPGETAVTLARHRHNALGRAMADAALRLDRTLDLASMVHDNETRASSRGRRHARWPLTVADARPESMLESLNLALIEWLGYPDPDLQVRFSHPDGTADRGDFWWDSAGLLGEVDGELKYDGTFGDPVAALRARRRRDARLIGPHVRSIAHWGWAETADVESVRALLSGHGLRPFLPENALQLHSFARLLRPAQLHPRDLNVRTRPRVPPTVSSDS
ncbi:type IV toxin-antitoxin system AbiEi family antitoxin domain-containing protein [Microbacterium telephonicum]|uniref:Transcriptional regulator, AbiEi antitoxin, Type IV TA system n=1 Tax=Microbacterium telephonicum TaxID=1714841 RepID=A0A498C384_9MICO|nr:hypothetical protein [Microbacterium telephonicum]RLK49066.1 hypothetical protein C7474_1198 [Microbacterium telephonicum]